MPSGGYRPGAGRPPKKPRVKKPPLPNDIVRDAKAANLQPLEYMLAVMNDLTADETSRDRMAIAAAPYCHPRATEAAPLGKKEQAQVDAATVQGTDWGNLVH